MQQCNCVKQEVYIRSYNALCVTTVHCMEFAAGLTLLQFYGDLRCGCVPRKYCSPVEQQQKLVARGLRDSCIGLQACDVFEQPTPAPPPQIKYHTP